jgi:25S rRNA (cytosine2870-C5)-methyltransferase
MRRRSPGNKNQSRRKKDKNEQKMSQRKEREGLEAAMEAAEQQRQSKDAQELWSSSSDDEEEEEEHLYAMKETSSKKKKSKKKPIVSSASSSDEEEDGKMALGPPSGSDSHSESSNDDEISNEDSESDSDSKRGYDPKVLDAFERMERKAAQLDEKRRQVEDESRLELEEAMGEQELGDASVDDVILRRREVGVDEGFFVSDLTQLYQRISDVVKVLSNFRAERHAELSRREYLELLKHDLCLYYGYSDFLIELFLEMFPSGEAVEFLEANEAPRPVTIRTNTLRTRRRDLARSLIDRGVNLDPIKWSKVGLQIFDSPVPLGATPEYLAGQYMLQGAASFLPVMALDAQPGERALDLCSAPGGKTTYIAAQMRNTGQLFANDANRDRCKALTANIHRLGVKNCVVTTLDGRKYPNFLSGFDRVLVDAPCAGFGVISRDASIKVNKGQEDIARCSALQRQLILAAIDCAKVGAIVVYSTCSITVDENEAVVAHALKHRDMRIVDTGFEFGRPGYTRYRASRFHPSMAKTRRFYPHAHNTDGFFVAKLEKMSTKRPVDIALEKERIREEQHQQQASSSDQDAGTFESIGDDDAQSAGRFVRARPATPAKSNKKSGGRTGYVDLDEDVNDNDEPAPRKKRRVSDAKKKSNKPSKRRRK